MQTKQRETTRSSISPNNQQTLALTTVTQSTTTSSSWMNWGKAVFTFSIATGVYALSKTVGSFFWDNDEQDHLDDTSILTCDSAVLLPAIFPIAQALPYVVTLAAQSGAFAASAPERLLFSNLLTLSLVLHETPFVAAQTSALVPPFSFSNIGSLEGFNTIYQIILTTGCEFLFVQPIRAKG